MKHSPSTRRAFVKSAAFGSVAIILTQTCSGCTEDTPANPYANLQSDNYLGDISIETRVTGEEVFLEGPAVGPGGRVYFTNVPASEILTWNPATQELAVFRQNTQLTNGLLFDANGHLLACEGGAGRVTRTNLETGEVTVLADNFEGNPLEAPNDVAVDAQGRIYFSSRPGPAPSAGYTNAVYRVDPDGSIHQLLREPAVHMPNGVVVSPDNQHLYLIEAHADADRYRHLKVFDLSEDGSIANGRVLYDFYPGRSGDGMCIDKNGNLFVAAGLHQTRGTSETLDTRPGIHVISPEGKLLAYRETPEDTVTNCSFGGEDNKTLYITCGSLLLSASIPNA